MAVESEGSRLSLDGRGQWMDNVFIARLWHSLKCGRIYLSSCDNLHELEDAIGQRISD
jgi:putative transposase